MTPMSETLFRNKDVARDGTKLHDQEIVGYDGLGHPRVLVPVEPCNQCGGPIVTIRGQVPGVPDRTVCPTCLVETLEGLVTGVPSDNIGGDDEG